MISSFVHEDRRYDFHDVRCVLGQKRFDRLPWSTRILAENLLRNRLPETADAQTIRDARKDAERLLDDDPGLESHVQLAGAVVDFSRASETALLGA